MRDFEWNDEDKEESIILCDQHIFEGEKEVIHRIDGYVVIIRHGVTSWYKNGKLHREDGPAMYDADERGAKRWYFNGLAHRVDGPAIIFGDRSELWCLNGLNHREDAPARSSSDGVEHWIFNGKKHRLDGPSEIFPKWKSSECCKNFWHRYGDFIKEEFSDDRLRMG